jgi:hypothetical protein
MFSPKKSWSWNSPRDDRIKVEDTHDEGRKIEDLDLEVLIVTMGASIMDTTQKRDSIDREREREKKSRNKIANHSGLAGKLQNNGERYNLETRNKTH